VSLRLAKQVLVRPPDKILALLVVYKRAVRKKPLAYVGVYSNYNRLGGVMRATHQDPIHG
jgi:hypothetical protein